MKDTSTFVLPFLRHFQTSKRSLLAVFLFLLLGYNGFSIFSIHLPFLPKTPSQSAGLWQENGVGESVRKLAFSSVMYAVKEENPNVSLSLCLNTHLPVLEELDVSISQSSIYERKLLFRFSNSKAQSKQFSGKLKGFFSSSEHCKVRFFMTWISSLNSFGDRELLAIESLFKSHPFGCLVIVSNSMDSRKGNHLLKPFRDKGFRVIAISPDYNYLFKNTPAEMWFSRLRKGNVDPGEVSLGQNLSNLLRLSLLYKFGGIYIDTDVIVLKNFSKLRNSIGAQTMDLEMGNWSRLNNAVLIFDKEHPLLFKFIEEFALTFDGNKWGHNGPYLVSRVVSRVNGRVGFNFTVLPPSAFYPVYWSRIGSLFQGPGNEIHSKWLINKLGNIRNQSFAVHLWNKQSRKLKVEEGSVISHILSDCCIFCNYSVSSL